MIAYPGVLSSGWLSDATSQIDLGHHNEPEKPEVESLLTEDARNSIDYHQKKEYKDPDHLLADEELGDETLCKKDRWRRIFYSIALIVLVVLTFIALVQFLLRASVKSWNAGSQKNLWNGTHTFKPTTIFISLDGFRADFLHLGLTPALEALIGSGVSPPYMMPSFPSSTFPNHLTLVTGLYPESHGIVGNTFWDPQFVDGFDDADAEGAMQSRWWEAEPVWVTAERQGLRTAINMWPGSEAHESDVHPTYLDKFDLMEPLSDKANKILQWLDLPGAEEPSAKNERPQLILSYVPTVDSAGHKYGPESQEVKDAIVAVDGMLSLIMHGLEQRNLSKIVNIVVVSDHGMATSSTENLIQIDDLVDMSLIDHIDGWPFGGLRLKTPDRDIPILHEQLLSEANRTGMFDVYTLETMPERYHFSSNRRIAPLWVIPKVGGAVVERKDFDVAEAIAFGKPYELQGLHGYDHEHHLMRAIFIARGPAFTNPQSGRMPAFQNTEVYNIVCHSVGMIGLPNNGTLHLPLSDDS